MIAPGGGPKGVNVLMEVKHISNFELVPTFYIVQRHISAGSIKNVTKIVPGKLEMS